MRLYHASVVVFATAFVVIGIALLVRTALEGGGVVGFLVGGLFVVLGAGRLTLELRRRGWGS